MSAEEQVTKIACHPTVLRYAGVGDGACGDAVIAVCGALECAETELASLRADRDRLRGALEPVVLNAELAPDPRMSGATDCYLVSLDDIEAARLALEPRDE